MRILNNRQVGLLRRALMLPFNCRWNGWVRGLTAYLG